MNSIKYLLVQRNGIMRIVSRLDSSKGFEIPIMLTVNIPDSNWEIPTVTASIHLPEREADTNNISATISLNSDNNAEHNEDEDEDLDDI